jgi:hypothetical protein
VDRLIGAHDALCGTLSRLLLLTLQQSTCADGSFSAFEDLLHRFNAMYVEHAVTEVTLLREIGARLNADQRATLRELIEGL